VIYIDHYGNALTGLRAAFLPRTAAIDVRGHRVSYAGIFAEAAGDSAFWYENSIGLVEIAANQGHASGLLGIEVGDAVTIIA
jgi:S-adenosylmethionine hydrolase